MPHPLIDQLRFTRSEFARGIAGVADDESTTRFPPMNALGWNVGHLAWQEQRYYLTFAQGVTPFPDIAREFASGGPASTPALSRVRSAWKGITEAADPWLDELDEERMTMPVVEGSARITGNLILRTIYHYWFHLGENMAIRQNLGHTRLPQFVGDIDGRAPYRRS
ncbi:MAG TPA: DinB family protein [Acidimicrobiia bacterium]|nr:DinB family protein [Acidimicrobiia bacterium]